MHVHYELRDLGRACCIPVHRYSVGIATSYTGLSQIPQITKNTGILPNIIVQPPPTPTSLMSRHVISVPRPSLFFSPLVLPCIAQIEKQKQGRP